MSHDGLEGVLGGVLTEGCTDSTWDVLIEQEFT